MYIRIHTHTHVYIYIYTYMQIYIYIFAYIYIHTNNAHTSVFYDCVRMHTHMYTYVCTRMCTNMYIYIYTNEVQAIGHSRESTMERGGLGQSITVAILAQGTSWAVAVTQAFLGLGSSPGKWAASSPVSPNLLQDQQVASSCVHHSVHFITHQSFAFY